MLCSWLFYCKQFKYNISFPEVPGLIVELFNNFSIFTIFVKFSVFFFNVTDIELQDFVADYIFI